jgi:hypothetical protein
MEKAAEQIWRQRAPFLGRALTGFVRDRQIVKSERNIQFAAVTAAGRSIGLQYFADDPYQYSCDIEFSFSGALVDLICHREPYKPSSDSKTDPASFVHAWCCLGPDEDNMPTQFSVRGTESGEMRYIAEKRMLEIRLRDLGYWLQIIDFPGMDEIIDVILTMHEVCPIPNLLPLSLDDIVGMLVIDRGMNDATHVSQLYEKKVPRGDASVHYSKDVLVCQERFELDRLHMDVDPATLDLVWTMDFSRCSTVFPFEFTIRLALGQLCNELCAALFQLPIELTNHVLFDHIDMTEYVRVSGCFCAPCLLSSGRLWYPPISVNFRRGLFATQGNSWIRIPLPDPVQLKDFLVRRIMPLQLMRRKIQDLEVQMRTDANRETLSELYALRREAKLRFDYITHPYPYHAMAARSSSSSSSSSSSFLLSRN